MGFIGASKPVGKSICESDFNRFKDVQVIPHNFIRFEALNGNCISLFKQKIYHP